MQEKELCGSILVVDDAPENLKLLLGILTESGCRVRVADGGQAALDSVAASLPDLILLDIKMPGLDGFEVCRRLKTKDRTRHIPVIFVSAMEDVTDKLKGFELGGADYITKPFEAREVLVRVETHLALYQTEEKLKAANEELGELNTQLEARVRQRTQELEFANQELRDSQERYREVVEGTADLITRVDKDWRFTYVNHVAERIFGITSKKWPLRL